MQYFLPIAAVILLGDALIVAAILLHRHYFRKKRVLQKELPLPEHLADLEEFCIQQGLACLVRMGPDSRSFGNILLEYGDSRVAVRIVRDRSQWEVGVAAPESQSGTWFDIGLLMNLLLGRAKDIVPLEEEIVFLKANWVAIVDLFSPERLEATEASLHELGRARFKRLMPGLLP
jgi:hypothetical protein